MSIFSTPQYTSISVGQALRVFPLRANLFNTTTYSTAKKKPLHSGMLGLQKYYACLLAHIFTKARVLHPVLLERHK